MMLIQSQISIKLKNIYLLSIFKTYLLFLVMINGFAQSIPPQELHFIKDYKIRNFYNSKVILTQVDFTKKILKESSHKLDHTTSPGCEFQQEDSKLFISNKTKKIQQSHIKVGEIYNYSVIDMEINTQNKKTCFATALLSIMKNKDNRLTISQKKIDSKRKQIVFEIFKKGELVLKEILFDKNLKSPNTIRVHLTGKFLNILLIKDNNWSVLGSFDLSKFFELRDKKILESFELFFGSTLGAGEQIVISKTEQYLTPGTGQADPKILHYEDGSPIIKNNKIWVAMTTRGYGTQLYQGIYSYDLESKKWEISGTLVFNKGDGLIRQWAASDVFYDRKAGNWKVFTVSHRDDHMLYSGEIKVDLRFGLTEINVSKVKYNTVNNEEDPSVIWDSSVGKWRMALCKSDNGYQTVLMEADEWNGKWKEIAVYKPTSSTGALIQKIGGKRYVFIGRGPTPCPLEILSYPEMEKVGELKLSEHPVGKNIWPAILPVSKENGTAYFLLTFDRDAWTGQRTYGNIYWYYSKEFAQNFWEYELNHQKVLSLK
mgnify:CR=1 FL=1